jgi:hypothetical protein
MSFWQAVKLGIATTGSLHGCKAAVHQWMVRVEQHHHGVTLEVPPGRSLYADEWS